MQLVRQINKPIQRLLLAAEINAGETASVGVNLLVEYGQVFLFNGLLAEITIGNAADVGTGNQLAVRGAEGGELSESMTTIAQAAAVGSRIFNATEFFPGRSISAKHYFGTPQKYFNQGFYSFSLSYLPNAVVAGNVITILTVFGDVINKDDKQFPYTFR